MDKNRYDLENGYLVFKDSRRLVHRWVAEQKYGKENLINKEVHHIDQDKRNNDKSNLIALSKEDHYYLTQHNNKINFFLSVIIWLGVFYFISIAIIKTISVVALRIAVLLILTFAVELRYGFFSRMIRRPHEQE